MSKDSSVRSGGVLTRRDMETIRRALNSAMTDRESYADAWGGRTPEGREALADIVRFEKLHAKLFGRKSARQEFADKIAAGKGVSIHDLHRAALHKGNPNGTE